MVPVILLNAEPEKLDNTLKSVERVAEANGYDSWIMLNIYHQRATDTNDLHSQINFDLDYENISHIEKIIKHNNPEIWAAWGTLINKRPYLVSCLFEKLNYQNGMTVNGLKQVLSPNKDILIIHYI